jgi:nucleoside-diphosphate-sugar epimerase
MPKELYAACKLAGESLCFAYLHTYGIEVVILRIANVYGPGQKSELFIPSIVRQSIESDVVKVGNIDIYRNFVYIKDVSRACAVMLKNRRARNTVINIAESSSSLRNVIDLVAKIKKKYTKKPLNIEQSKSLVRLKSTELGRFFLDCRKAHSLGWMPKYTLEKGLEETFLHELGDKNKD